MQHRFHSPRTVLTSVALTVLSVASAADALPRRDIELDPPEPVELPPRPTRPPPPPPDCAPPTIDQCKDPAYLGTTCGRITRDKCGELILPEYKAGVAALSSTTQVLVSRGANKQLATARAFSAVEMPDRNLDLGTLTFQTASQIGRAMPATSNPANTQPQHPAWESNGAAITSCAEYAYEYFYGYSRFLDAADTCGGDAECIYQLAQQSTVGGLNRELSKRNGAKMSYQPASSNGWNNKRNIFFIYKPDFLRSVPAYNTDAAFRAKADQIIVRVQSATGQVSSNRFAWHQQRHAEFFARPALSAAEAEDIRVRRTVYEEASETYNVAMFAIPLLEAVVGSQLPEYQVETQRLLNQYYASRDASAAMRLHSLLAEWDHVSVTDGVTADRGCLSSSDLKCDWLPSDFTNDYYRPDFYPREAAFTRCVDITGDDFAQVPAFAKTDSDAFTAWLEAHDLPKLAATSVGQRANDSEEFGDRDWFAAGYDYDAGWTLAADRQPSTNRICKLKGNAYAKGGASAWALGQEIRVLDTDSSLSAREVNNVIKWHSHLRVLGQDVYSPIDGSVTASSMTPVEKKEEKTLAQRTYTKWLSISGVMVKLQAKAELKAGYDLSFKAQAASGCDPNNLAYDTSLSARPWLKVHVVPEASVGIGLLQAGARGDIDLVEASVPASATAKLVGGVNDLTLKLGLTGNLEFEALGGSLSVFLEACAPLVGCSDLASKKIYEWDPYRAKLPLFDYRKDIRFNVFDAGTNPGTNPFDHVITDGVLVASAEMSAQPAAADPVVMTPVQGFVVATPAVTAAVTPTFATQGFQLRTP